MKRPGLSVDILAMSEERHYSLCGWSCTSIWKGVALKTVIAEYEDPYTAGFCEACLEKLALYQLALVDL